MEEYKASGDGQTKVLKKALPDDPKAIARAAERKYPYYRSIHCKSWKFANFAACNLHGAAFMSGCLYPAQSCPRKTNAAAFH